MANGLEVRCSVQTELRGLIGEWPPRESNPHVFRQEILSFPRLPFRHGATILLTICRTSGVGPVENISGENAFKGLQDQTLVEPVEYALFE